MRHYVDVMGEHCTARANGEECDWFNQGKQARRFGKPALSNPFIGFPKAQGARRCWEQGWTTEDKALRTGEDP